MEDEFKRAAEALGHRQKQNCRNLGLDLATAAKRNVAERLVHYFNTGFGPSPAMLVGGLLFPQAYRPTDDADLRVVRRYSDTEIHNAMSIIGPLLKAEGIEVTKVKIRQLHAGTGVPVTRIAVEATSGGTQANTQLDLALATGPEAFPPKDDVRWTLFPSFMSKAAGYRALAQPMETAMAEKWLAVINKDRDDLRMKHEADIVLLSAQDLDVHRVAAELRRVARNRGIDEAVLEYAPRWMSWPQFERRENSWVVECAKRRLDMSLELGFQDLHAQNQELRAALEFARRQELFRHFQRRQVNRRAALDMDFGRTVASDYGSNVVAFKGR